MHAKTNTIPVVIIATSAVSVSTSAGLGHNSNVFLSSSSNWDYSSLTTAFGWIWSSTNVSAHLQGPRESSTLTPGLSGCVSQQMRLQFCIYIEVTCMYHLSWFCCHTCDFQSPTWGCGAGLEKTNKTDLIKCNCKVLDNTKRCSLLNHLTDITMKSCSLCANLCVRKSGEKSTKWKQNRVLTIK